MKSHQRIQAVVVVVVAFAAGCWELDRSDRAAAPDGPPSECDAGDAAFVVDATLSLLGQRPGSHAEIELGTTTIAALEGEFPGEGRRRWALQLMEHPAFVDRWSELLLDNLYVPRTGIQAMGECYGTTRLPDPVAAGEVGLAEFVRDSAAIDASFADSFTFRDLLKQSLVLDDLSPGYRAHLFALLTRLNGCVNVDPVGQELAYRDEIGHTFEAAYLNRDPVCLTCHTSSFAVTDSDDPETDRHWPLRGRFEDSVFGGSGIDDPHVPRAVFRVDGFVNVGGAQFEDFDGGAAYCFDVDQMGYVPAPGCGPALLPCDDGTEAFCLSPLDVPACVDDGAGGRIAACADTPFCIDDAFTAVDVVTCAGGTATCPTATPLGVCGDFSTQPSCDDDGVAFCAASVSEGEGGSEEIAFSPWGADAVCGSFARELVADDPAGVDAHFASLRGQRVTVAQLEQALKRGVDVLAAGGLPVDDDDNIADPDAAFAYLVAANIVDNTWREVVGAPLTIATHFPRNQHQRDLLQSLTDRFVAARFSLKGLLADVVTSGYVNILPPEAACGEPFAYPPVFDPWVRDEPDPAARNNASADAVHALSARTLLSASYAALGWPRPVNEAFPEGVSGLDVTCFEQFLDCTALAAACLSGECCAEHTASCSDVDDPLSEAEVQRGVGVFHGISEKGFRGLDFQARLFFEARFGSCERPATVERDAVDDIVARGADASIADVVLAVKERFIHDTRLDADERALLEGLFEGSLDRPASDIADLDARLRVVCGALLASPQFQLTGVSSTTPSSPARLQPPVAEICRVPLPGCG